MIRKLLLSLAFLLLLPAAALADPVVVDSVTASQFYPYCGNTTLTTALLPDVTPPVAPEMNCTDYNAGSGTLTARMASAPAGAYSVAFYMRANSYAASLSVKVDGVVKGTGTVPASTEGWFTVDVGQVPAGAAVDAVVSTSWRGTGQNRVGAIHGNVNPITIGQPGNWARTPVPQNVALETSLAPSGLPMSSEWPKELAGQAAAGGYVNTSQYTPVIYHVPADTPLQPVRECRGSGGYCVPAWGASMYNMWRATMGVDNAATYDSVTGKMTSGTYLGGGIPLTDAVVPAPGTDQEAVICQDDWRAKNADGTDFVRPDGQFMQGRCWEVGGLQADETYDPNQPISVNNTKWKVRYASRRTGYVVNGDPATVDTTNKLDTLSGTYQRITGSTWYGPQVAVPGDPNSTTFYRGWTVTASGLPLWNDVISDSDCQAVLDGHAIDFGHAVGIEMQFHRYQGTAGWWPAYLSDGQSGSKLASGEGERGFLPASVQMPAGLNAWGQAYFRTLQKYGFVDDDTTGGGPGLVVNADGSYKSGGALMARSDRGSVACSNLGVGAAQLKAMPWGQAQLIAKGSDALPNPLQ